MDKSLESWEKANASVAQFFYQLSTLRWAHVSVSGCATQVGLVGPITATQHKDQCCSREGTRKWGSARPVEPSTDCYSLTWAGWGCHKSKKEKKHEEVSKKCKCWPLGALLHNRATLFPKESINRRFKLVFKIKGTYVNVHFCIN